MGLVFTIMMFYVFCFGYAMCGWVWSGMISVLRALWSCFGVVLFFWLFIRIGGNLRSVLFGIILNTV